RRSTSADLPTTCTKYIIVHVDNKETLKLVRGGTQLLVVQIPSHDYAIIGPFTAWHATPSISAGASRRHRSKASGQRGLKAQPGGGSIGLGISPFTGIRWRPLIARSGTAPSNILV